MYKPRPFAFSAQRPRTILSFRRPSHIIVLCSKETCRSSDALEFRKLILRALFEVLRKRTLIVFALANFPLSTWALLKLFPIHLKATETWSLLLWSLILTCHLGVFGWGLFWFFEHLDSRPNNRHVIHKIKLKLSHWASQCHLSYISLCFVWRKNPS